MQNKAERTMASEDKNTEGMLSDKMPTAGPAILPSAFCLLHFLPFSTNNKPEEKR